MKLTYPIATLALLVSTAASLHAQTLTLTQSRRYYEIKGEVNNGFTGTPPPLQEADSFSNGPISLGSFGIDYFGQSTGGSPGSSTIDSNLQSEVTLTGQSLTATANLDTYSAATSNGTHSSGQTTFFWNLYFTLTGEFNYSLSASTFLDDFDSPNRVLFGLNRNGGSFIDLGTASANQGGQRPDGLSKNLSGILPAGSYHLYVDLISLAEATGAGQTDDSNADLSFTFTATPTPEPAALTMLLAGAGFVALYRPRRAAAV